MAGIIIGFDDSRCARSALEAAIDIGLRLGEPLVVAFAYGPPSRISGEEYGAHSKALQELGSKCAQEAVARAKEAGAEVETVLLPGRPAEALNELAEQRDALMIVVGTYGETPLRSAILGSTPHKLLHLTERPVLCVPLPELRR